MRSLQGKIKCVSRESWHGTEMNCLRNAIKCLPRMKMPILSTMVLWLILSLLRWNISIVNICDTVTIGRDIMESLYWLLECVVYKYLLFLYDCSYINLVGYIKLYNCCYNLELVLIIFGTDYFIREKFFFVFLFWLYPLPLPKQFPKHK